MCACVLRVMRTSVSPSTPPLAQSQEFISAEVNTLYPVWCPRSAVSAAQGQPGDCLSQRPSVLLLSEPHLCTSVTLSPRRAHLHQRVHRDEPCKSPPRSP